MIERYVVRYGKFGAYFYDMEGRHEMSLKEVETMLNMYSNILKKP